MLSQSQKAPWDRSELRWGQCTIKRSNALRFPSNYIIWCNTPVSHTRRTSMPSDNSESSASVCVHEFCWNMKRADDFMTNSVDLVIFACLDFREFVILGLYTKSRIRELAILMIGSAIINIISWDSKIREFVLLAKFAKIKTSRILPHLQYTACYK